MGKLFLSKLIVFGLLLELSTARPSDDRVTMSGEPTHFQVDDKAAELEINANAMGVKVNAKPASLQVVSKPGAPSVPVARPAVVVPQLPAPYLTAPYYPSPMMIGHRRTTRRHHFFMDSDAGNYNYKKTRVPTKKSHGNKNSKKSELASGEKKAKKRQWIQRLPVVSQLVPFPQVTNVRVHPYVQQMAALAQGFTRQSIPRLPYQQVAQMGPRQMYTFRQRLSDMMPNLAGSLVGNGVARSLVNRAVFVPPFPAYHPVFAPAPVASFVPLFNQGLPYNSPRLVRAPVSGFNGYYDPLISRDFIPDMGTIGMPRIPTPRTFIPGGMIYPGVTPLGLSQRVGKRLTIPKHPSTKNPRKTTTGDSHATKRTDTPEKEASKKEAPGKSRKRRSVKETLDTEKHSSKKHGSHGENVAKRQFILTRPVIPQQQVTYVPVVSSPQTQALPMKPGRDGRNLVLNFPLKTSTAFVLKAPSETRGSQMYQTISSRPAIGAFYQPMIDPGVFGNLGNNDAVQGWGAQIPETQSSMVQSPGVQTPGVERSGVGTQSPWNGYRLSLGQLAGIQGQPVFRNNPHMTTLYTNDPLPSQYQDQIFGDSSLHGRTRIPRRKHQRHRFGYLRGNDEYDREYAFPEESEEEPSSYEDGLTSDSSFDRVDDEGSYTERTMPDGRTVLKKDHVGFGPITVQAKTAEAASRDPDSATDMNLDSDKRKMISRPTLHSYLDKRLGIPKPEE